MRWNPSWRATVLLIASGVLAIGGTDAYNDGTGSSWWLLLNLVGGALAFDALKTSFQDGRRHEQTRASRSRRV